MGFQIRKIRIFWLILLGLIICFLCYQYISPTGSWVCHQDFTAPNAWQPGRSCLGAPSPSDRVISGGNSLLVLADPVYFSVFSPRAFSRAEVSIVYRPHLSSATPIFEAGFLADKKLWRYQLKPVYNLWLEQGFSHWTEITEGNLRLFQRQDRFKSVKDFLAAWHKNGSSLCTVKNCLAVYNINLSDFPPALDLNSLNKEESATVFPYTLRGTHQFYFYLPAAGLQLSGELIDRNENKDKDEAEFRIVSGQHLAAAFTLPDQRSETETSGDFSQPQPFKFSRADLAPGLYRLEFRANDDLMISGLRVNSSYLSAINKIAVSGQEPVELITDAPYLQIKTLDPTALQTINFGSASIAVSEIYQQYEVKSQQAGWQKITFPRGGLILENNGVFAARSSALLNPDYPRLDRFSPLADRLDFVLADYQPAQTLAGDWRQSQIDFSTAGFYRENSRYSLLLSAPGMTLDNGNGGLIEIKEIKVRFYGKSLFTKLKEIFSHFLTV